MVYELFKLQKKNMVDNKLLEDLYAEPIQSFPSEPLKLSKVSSSIDDPKNEEFAAKLMLRRSGTMKFK